MKHFLDFVARSLVDNPDDVQVTEIEKGAEKLYRVSLHPDDVGLVIGKGGRTIGAIRSIVSSASREGDRLTVEVVENS